MILKSDLTFSRENYSYIKEIRLNEFPFLLSEIVSICSGYFPHLPINDAHILYYHTQIKSALYWNPCEKESVRLFRILHTQYQPKLEYILTWDRPDTFSGSGKLY